METRKGVIAVGSDADFVIWKPDEQFTVTAEKLHHRHKLTPYEGEVLSGVVQQSFLRGHKISEVPQGHLLLRQK